MSVAIRTAVRIQDQDDAPTLGAGQNGYALTWDNASGAFVATALFSGGLLATGATTGATSQAQAFTNGVITGAIKPAANSTTALQLQNATGASILNVDTTNSRVGIGTSAPATKLHAVGGGADRTFVTVENTVAASAAAIKLQNSAGRFAIFQYSGASYVVGESFSVFTESDIPIVFSTNASAASGGTAGHISFSPGGYGSERMRITPVGLLGIGTIAPATQLHTLWTSTVTNIVLNLVTIGHDTTGTAAAGFGAGLLFTLESSTTAAQDAARIQAITYEATHATRKYDLVGTAFDAGGEREGWRVRGNGSAPAIGFLGATPQARIAHVADPAGGATVDAEARSAINSILATLEGFGFHATS